MSRVLLGVFGILALVVMLVKREVDERERKRRWREIERNAELIRRVQSEQDSVQDMLEKPPAADGTIVLARGAVAIHTGGNTTYEHVPMSPMGYGEELAACWMAADGTLFVVGNQFRPERNKLSVMWKRAATGAWSTTLALGPAASLVERAAGNQTSCTHAGVTYVLANEWRSVEHESVRGQRVEYAREQELHALRRMM